MNKKLIRRILAVAVIATFLIGTMSFAQEYNAEIPEEEIQVIDADEIGVKTMDHLGEANVMVEETEEDEDVAIEVEDKDVDEAAPPAKKIVEEDLIVEEDTEVPEGMFEGRVESVYLPVNNYDCEIHDGCHKCEKCTLSEEIGYDEEINPNGGWYRAKFCDICGHGGCEPITESEYDDYFENE